MRFVRVLVAIIVVVPLFLYSAPCPQITRPLQLDDKGTDVSALQQYFIEAGYLESVSIDGYFNIETQRAVQNYQADMGIVSSGSPASTGWGVVGPATQTALAKCLTKAPAPAPAPKPAPTPTAPTPPPAPVSASDTAAQMEALLAQLTSLQTLLATLLAAQAQLEQGGTVSPPASTPPPPPVQNPPPSTSQESGPILTRTLAVGSQGEDVIELQEFLISQNLLAPDLATGYFGSLTEAAVQQYQVQNGIVSSGTPETTGYGAVGPKTRTSIASSGTAVVSDSGDTTAPSARSCTIGSVALTSGSSQKFYAQSRVSSGESCDANAQSRTCTDGTLSGDSAYQYPTCASVSASACELDGLTISNGSSVLFYSQADVPSTSSCGAFSQERICKDGDLSGDDSYRYRSCSVQGVSSCVFNGQSIAAGQSTTAYQSSSVPAGQSCVSQTRTCTSGVLSGSYTYASCVAGSTPTSCTWDGQTIPSGQSVTAYQSSSVPYGSLCSSVAQTRTCTNGVLSGTYTSSACSVATAASCSFNGTTIANGQSKTAYLTASVPYGSVCSSQSRTCIDGALSGSYTYATCAVGTPAACTWNGQTLANGQSTTAYLSSSVPYGQTCTSQSRVCQNGVLSGTYQSATCAATPAASCTFNGATVAHGQSKTAYLTSSVPYGQVCSSQTRTCTNGALSGTYSYATCSVGTAASCTFNGTTLANGQSTTAYLASSVPYGQTCSSQTRTCQNGALSGTYTYGTCSSQSAASCTLDGLTTQSGASRTYHSKQTVPYGQVCSSFAQTRTCTNGVLSGDSTYQYGSCAVATASACTLNGVTIAHGSSQTFYSSQTVSSGQVCSSVGQLRTCSNGVLTGSAPYQYPSCSVSAPASCSWNGSTIANGISVTAYLTSSVPYGQTCSSQSRVCQNGTLSGTYAYATCSVGTASSCTLDGATVANGASKTFYSSRTVAAGAQCSSIGLSRTCSNGTFSGSATYQYAACTTASDTTPPTTPSTPVAGAITQTSIALSWSASTDAVGVTTYLIERCTGVGCTNFTQIQSQSGTSYSNTGLATNTSYTYRVRAGDAAGNRSAYSGVLTRTTTANEPVLSISANPTSVAYNQSATITWSATNVTSCAVTKGSASFGSGTSGSLSSGALTANTTFTLTCQSAAGQRTGTVVVAVGTTPPPTVSYTINGSKDITLKVGDAYNESWSSTNAVSAVASFTQDSSSCGISGTGPFDMNGAPNQTSPVPVNGSGQSTVTDCWAGHTYVTTITVTDAQGRKASSSATARISVPVPAAPPTASFTVNGGTGPVTAKVGDTLRYAWSSTNAASTKIEFTQDTTSCGIAGQGPIDYGLSPTTAPGSYNEPVLPCWENHNYVVIFTATDSQGRTASASVAIRVPGLLSTPIASAGKYFFVPNQGQAITWNPANAHIEGTFSNLSIWTQLQGLLAANSGGFGIYSPEVWYTSDATLTALRQKGIRVDVEPPGFTQCETGLNIAQAEIMGTGPWCNTPSFHGINLCGKGWYVTKEGTPYAPEEIVVDERIGHLLTYPGHRVCALGDNMATLVQDYVDYTRVMRQKWPTNTPRLSLWWNIVTTFDERPNELDQLIKGMCADGMCPTTIYLDIDWTMEPQKMKSMVDSVRSVTNRNGVGLGIGISQGNPALEDGGYMLQERADKSRLDVALCGASCDKNQLYQGSLLNILQWTMDVGIVDANTRLHLQSWQKRPVETGTQINENTPYSLANTANRLFNELLIVRGHAKQASASTGGFSNYLANAFAAFESAFRAFLAWLGL